MPIVFAKPPTQSIVYNIAGAVYDSISHSVAAQETEPKGLVFKPDGLKMYIVGNSSNSTRQYSMSTPWDLTTLSYDSVGFIVANDVTGLTFKPDGTEVYVAGIGTSSRPISQFTLNTAWDMSSYSSLTSFNVAAQTSSPQGVKIKPDGTKMYICSPTGILQYTLSTPWAVTSASYDSVSFVVSSQDANCRDFGFNPDGTKMYMVGINTASIYQYTLSTPWDISTASYDSVLFDFSSQDSTPHDFAFKPDTTKMYMIGAATDSVYQYSL